MKEEYEEVIKAIDKKDHENLKEEIGDLIWTLLLMVQIASEENHFNAEDVLKYTRDKICISPITKDAEMSHEHLIGYIGSCETR